MGETSVDVAGVDREVVQRRTVKVLLGSQAAGGIGLVSTYIVTALLAKDMTGSTALATIAASCLSIGAALASYPISRLANQKGRRPALRVGYAIGVVGATIAVVAAIVDSYPLLVVGVFGAGAGSAANMATRYAASDLADPTRRARTISLIVWATTLGSGTGSTVAPFVSDFGENLGLPPYAGSYVLSALAFLVACAVIETQLRPDPLVLAGGIGKKEERTQSAAESFRLILAKPAARLAVLAMIVSQVTMVGVMALTPLHMDAGGQSKQMIGLMMTFHILGMYLFSPLVGSLTDRIGRYPMIYIAGALCTAGALWAAVTPPEGVVGVFMGNFLVGLGWCFGVIAASSLLVAEFPIEQRVGVQGAGDLAMMGSGAAAGVLSGVLYTAFEYSGVNIGNAAFGILLLVATFATAMLVRRSTPRIAVG